MESDTDSRYCSIRTFLTTMWNSKVNTSPLLRTLIFTNVGDKILFASVAAQTLVPLSL